MSSTEMMERFRRFASVGLSTTVFNRMNQVSEILLKTDTVRIILTREECRTESLDVDIEVSLPFLRANSNAISIQRYIDRVIVILEYLRRLTLIGFSMELLQEEGIFVASTALGVDTEESVFQALMPPG
jgi:hypothetical protein